MTLSQGFWLGETAVTQALWRAVMGNAPSHFRGDERPVEQVSWDDCRDFVGALGKSAPGFRAALPTEAQWEYACRAGTRTPFSFGEELTPELANYNGNLPYHTGAKGEYRQQTLPVHQFQANPWGLYQMHGNVREWCQDWFGDYPEGAVTDPEGPGEGRYRVLRGGSWFSRGRYLRAAYRSRNAPDSRRHFGLRLAGGSNPQAGRVGAGAMTADGRTRSGRQGSGQGPGDGGVESSHVPPKPLDAGFNKPE